MGFLDSSWFLIFLSIVQSYEYDSFGKIISSTGTVEQSYTYTGREWDSESSLFYYRARYYDPGIGRFMSEDPIGFKGGNNFYEAMGNDPVNWVDPWGLLECQIGPDIPKIPLIKIPSDINKFNLLPKIPGKLKLEPKVDPKVDIKNLIERPKDEISRLTNPKNYNDWKIEIKYEHKF